jgi:YjbE family integral membrane protein
MWNYATGSGSIFLVNLILSGDNALVIGMACANLPPKQRRLGILFGSMAAIGLRILMALATAVLLRVPLLQALGGLLLVWIAFKLANPPGHGDGPIGSGATVWETVKTIALADLIMSLDNVLAIGGIAKGSVPLLLTGVVLTIPIIMWGSGLISSLVQRAPWLTYVGAAVLAWTGGSMVALDPALQLASAPTLSTAAMALVVGATVYERKRSR